MDNQTAEKENEAVEEKEKVSIGERLKETGFFNWKTIVAIALFVLGFLFYFFFVGVREKPLAWLVLVFVPPLIPATIDMFQSKGGFSIIRYFKIYVLHLLDLSLQLTVLIAFVPIMLLQLVLGPGMFLLIFICGFVLLMIFLKDVLGLAIKMKTDELRQGKNLILLIAGFAGGIGIWIGYFKLLDKHGENIFNSIIDFFIRLHEKMKEAIQNILS